MTSNANHFAVEVQDVTKAFANTVAVRDLSFTISGGSVFGLLGPNGAGKTTTIRLLTGIAYPTRGTVRVLNNHAPSEVRHRIGYLPEEKGLYKRMKVRDYLIFIARLKDWSRPDAKTKADSLLEQFRFAEWRLERCDKLSKGMGQKVQIMATLIHEPDLVVLDEPFSGLDPINVELVRNMVLELRDSGRTVIFSTHVMEQAEQLCSELILIDKGHTLVSGRLADVLQGYGNTVRVDYHGNGKGFKDLPGVTRVNDAGQRAELTLSSGADAQALLRRLIEQVEVRKFDLTQVSLHEVFVREVSESTEASGEADA